MAKPCNGHQTCLHVCSLQSWWALVCWVDESMPTICGPHHHPVINRGHGKETDIRTTSSRTHVYLMTLNGIFGPQPSYRQITSSSVSLAWMCSWETARDDGILRDCSIIQVQRVKGKHHAARREDRERTGEERRKEFANTSCYKREHVSDKSLRYTSR